MEKLGFIKAVAFTGQLLFCSLNAQINSTALPPLNSQKPINKIAPATKKESSFKPTEKPKPPVLVPGQAGYLHPGILIFKNGAWEGSDHLLNLTNNIGVYVVINKPEEFAEAISADRVRESIEKAFKDTSINPLSLVAVGQPPLPAFEIEILIYPVGKGFVAGLDGRLFESVTIPRMNTLGVDLAFQAITWEKKSLIVGPLETLNEQIIKAATDITNSFIERFKGYKPLMTNDKS